MCVLCDRVERRVVGRNIYICTCGVFCSANRLLCGLCAFTSHLHRTNPYIHKKQHNRGFDRAEYRAFPERYRPTFHETVRGFVTTKYVVVVCTCMHACVCVCVCAYMSVCVTHIRMHICVFVRVHVLIYGLSTHTPFLIPPPSPNHKQHPGGALRLGAGQRDLLGPPLPPPTLQPAARRPVGAGLSFNLYIYICMHAFFNVC